MRKYSNIKLLRMSQSNCSICILLRYSIDVILTWTGFLLLIQRMVLLNYETLDRRNCLAQIYQFFAAEIRKYYPKGFDSTCQILFLQTSIFWKITDSWDRTSFFFFFFSLKHIFQSLKFIFGHLSRKTYKQIELFSFSLAELGTY